MNEFNDEEEFDIDEFLEELAEDVFAMLIEKGYVPSRGEAYDIAEIVYEIMIEHGLFFEDEE